MTSLDSWNTNDVIQWVKTLPPDYHHCIKVIENDDIDGKFLKVILGDELAKDDFLRELFPDSKYKGLLFMRKLNKFNENINNNNQIKHNSNPSNPSNAKSNPSNDKSNTNSLNITQSKLCAICNTKISAFLIDNHQRHCKINKDNNINADNDDDDDDDDDIDIDIDINNNNKPIATAIEQEKQLHLALISCKYCEYEVNIDLIDKHELYCGSKTDICVKCARRDTVKNLAENNHKCQLQTTPLIDLTQDDDDNNNNSNNNNNNDIFDAVLMSQLSRQITDLRKILHGRFVTNYESYLDEYDAFGNKKINNCNKSKAELRLEYNAKYKKTIKILTKILRNILSFPLNIKYHKLECNNIKLKSTIFCYGPCCSFLKLCNFEYINNDKYVITNINDNKLKTGVNVLNKQLDLFNELIKSEKSKQNEWELNQAYNTNKNSLFFGSWSCKTCNHLNKKTKKCKLCGNTKKHSNNYKKEKKDESSISISIEKWICGYCMNRNSIQLFVCDNCNRYKYVEHSNNYQSNNNNNNNLKRTSNSSLSGASPPQKKRKIRGLH